MLETLINFLENSIPDPVDEDKKERYRFQEGWHPPKGINFGLLVNIIKEIEKLDFVYKVNTISFNYASKKVTITEDGYTNYDINLAGAIINVEIAIIDTHAVNIEVHTTAYTSNQIEFVKNKLSEIVKL
jgi:hypothetical protein